MRTSTLIHTAGIVGIAVGQSSPSLITLTGTKTALATDLTPTLSLTGIEVSTISTGSASDIITGTDAVNSTSTTTKTSTSKSLTVIVGGRPSTVSGNATTSASTSRTTTAMPTNTQPCNNHVEYCTRKYSNITEVCAHNSPFSRKNNIASNQVYGVTKQLNDGIRMLQGQVHYENGTLFYCHTSCQLLNAGPVEDYLREVTDWLSDHPFEVITILLGNADYQEKDAEGNALVTSKNFVEPIEKSGLLPYIYQPPKTAMTRDDWPTLSELILKNKRVVMFIDYNFDTTAVPYILWEFYNMWETPFSPTDPTFPCTVSRPEGLSPEQISNMMYMANHNLNVEAKLFGMDLLVPNTVDINLTNGLNGSQSLGAMVNSCTADWGRPPNFLLVDYYNYGPFNGSVFEVAARANNVTYNRKCCGTESSASRRFATMQLSDIVLIGVAFVLLQVI